MNKKIILAFMVAASLLCIPGCGKETNDDKKEEKKETVTISTKDVVKKVSDKLSLPSMIGSGSKDDVDKNKDAKDVFEYLCDVDYDKVDEFYISYASDEENPTVEEVFVIKLKDESDVDAAKDELNARIDRRKLQFATYKPEEVPKLNNAKVESNKNMVILIISTDAKAGIDEFKSI